MSPAVRIDTVTVTLFTSFAATSKTEASLTLPKLVERIRTTTAPAKDRLPWIKLARFGETRTDKNSLRHDGNLIEISGIEADYDGEQIAFDQALDTLGFAGLTAIIYTSPSHTPAKPRWRVLCPTSRPLPPGDRAKLLGRLNGLFRGVFSGESWTLSQSYYLGSVNRNAAHQVELLDGFCIDEMGELDAGAIGKAQTKPSPNGSVSPGGKLDEAAEIAEIVSGASFHFPCVRLLGLWAVTGVALLDARKKLKEAFEKVAEADRGPRWQKRFDDIDRCLLDIYGKQAKKADAAGQTDRPAEEDLILSTGAPLMSAREFLRRHHTLGGARTLLHQNSAFYSWQGSRHVERSPEEIRATLYAFLDGAKRRNPDGDPIPFDPTRSKVANVLEATAAEAQIPLAIRPPAWLDGRAEPPPSGLIACRNGLLEIATRKLLTHTSAFFNLNALTFDFSPDAPEPKHWLGFLHSVWPNDQQAVETLQEEFGLCLTGDTRHQKACLMVGPKRSGKGTIARVLTQLVGAENVAGPTLSSLAQNFGLQPLIGKRVAIISDARLSGKADQQIIVERLLSITGEDSLTIDRKNRTAWTGKLDARFIILTNELPRLTDSSGALASRFIILTMTRSFFGQEDLGLAAKLSPELPGILLWALKGLERLRKRGYFVPPASSQDAQRELEDLGSPIGAFLRDRCFVGPGINVRCEHLYEAWCAWCREHGREHPGTTQNFGRDLAAAVAGLRVERPREDGGGRARFYNGVMLIRVDVVRDGPRDTALQPAFSETVPTDGSDPYA